MVKRYPRTLSSGANNTVLALSETEAGKLFHEDTRSEIGSEAEKMKFANQVNGLIVKFVRLDLNEEMNSDMLVGYGTTLPNRLSSIRGGSKRIMVRSF